MVVLGFVNVLYETLSEQYITSYNYCLRSVDGLTRQTPAIMELINDQWLAFISILVTIADSTS